MSQQSFSLNNLDFNNAGAWPKSVKAFFCGLIVVLVLAGTWWFFIRDKQDMLESLERQEQERRTEFETKQGRAANLEPLKLQLAQMEQMLQQMLRQLPSRTEMPDLIVDISQTALASGINNELFQPQAEIPKEFYAEKPISLRMVGGYHQFGAFVSGVASLPRVVIMTMHDISLKPRETNGGIRSDNLVLEGTVKTYRYLDEEEAAAQTATDTTANGAQ
ncbi:type 4a pilus biogenesis protein PilO [Coralloluteibacterium stylophorae]|uniref:Type 4a pilus biogenesis protein PilO n=1 Tax=Coralloluteibacterium stylophorae TaxID=1776034 RepID=A0A8J8AXT4_9GAMM|nr:type 4a pilus biogenesis protein PilO [Coralloluteibacterium stylophorae]MBS7458394.1 type 4a pilus biogenesis protein PilO [Coralloluteibacterium stylophorae]